MQLVEPARATVGIPGVQVEPQFTFEGMDSSPALEALICQRIDGLERVHPRIIACRVVVEVPHRAARPAEVTAPLGAVPLASGRPSG